VPSPSAVACAGFDLAQASQPLVVLHLASEPDRDEVEGLNGSSVLGDTTFDFGDWHQPSPQRALVVGSAEPLLAGSFLEPGGLPLCLASAAVDAAPFSLLAASPDKATLIHLAATATGDTNPAAFGFAAPSQPGEWVIRVALSFATVPGPSRQESFFRLRVDVPAPIVEGTASAPVACRPPGPRPPRVFLSVDGSRGIAAASGSFTWGTLAGDAPAPLGPRLELDQGAKLTLRTENDVCAAWWRIQLAVLPVTAGRDQEPIADLVPARSGYDNPGKANRFTLSELPPGNWVVQAGLEYADGKGNLIGQTTNFWNLVLP
jgi:hypothetical protein